MFFLRLIKISNQAEEIEVMAQQEKKSEQLQIQIQIHFDMSEKKQSSSQITIKQCLKSKSFEQNQ